MNPAAVVDRAPDGSAWISDRIKVVEDQRASDVADIAYLRDEVARLVVENARLRARLAAAGRDLDRLTKESSR